MGIRHPMVILDGGIEVEVPTNYPRVCGGNTTGVGLFVCTIRIRDG